MNPKFNLNTYRTNGERAVRAANGDQAAKMFATRKARRIYGENGEAINIVALRGNDESAAEYCAVLRVAPDAPLDLKGARFLRIRFTVTRSSSAQRLASNQS